MSQVDRNCTVIRGRALERKVYLEGAAERDRERQSPRTLEREPVENVGLDIGGASQNGKIEGS